MYNMCNKKCCHVRVQARDVAEQRLAAKTAEVVQLRTALIQAQGKVRTAREREAIGCRCVVRVSRKETPVHACCK